ncbi:MAG TPA: ankyrin repeat domain-containing protein [Gemmatimonadales bacterium]|nr:ankyrin repeat domain-containing protein [Gemmatimonadales bacterium]
MAASHSPLVTLFHAIASRDEQAVARLLDAAPDLARQAADIGATRQESLAYFFDEIKHYVYTGDTALHVAAAAYEREMARTLLARGADVAARNRRGAQPLHYAADGGPDAPTWNPTAQATMIECLIAAGADPNAADKSGVAPLHRAVRGRCASAVRALLANGAHPRGRNGSGSTPLHLAVQNTGRGGSGSPAAREQQKEIIALLLKHGARLTDKDAAGKTVKQSVASDWLLEVIEAA